LAAAGCVKELQKTIGITDKLKPRISEAKPEESLRISDNLGPADEDRCNLAVPAEIGELLADAFHGVVLPVAPLGVEQADIATEWRLFRDPAMAFCSRAISSPRKSQPFRISRPSKCSARISPSIDSGLVMPTSMSINPRFFHSLDHFDPILFDPQTILQAMPSTAAAAEENSHHRSRAERRCPRGILLSRPIDCKDFQDALI
jgi:hypothetical protein